MTFLYFFSFTFRDGGRPAGLTDRILESEHISEHTGYDAQPQADNSPISLQPSINIQWQVHWYNNNLYNLKRSVLKSGMLLGHSLNDAYIRCQLIARRKKYKRECRKAKQKYWQSMATKLGELSGKYPTAFCETKFLIINAPCYVKKSCFKHLKVLDQGPMSIDTQYDVTFH